MDVSVTGLRIIGHVGLRATRVEVMVNGKPAYVPVDWVRRRILVKSHVGQFNLSMDDYDNFEGDLCAFIEEHINEQQKSLSASQRND